MTKTTLIIDGRWRSKRIDASCLVYVNGEERWVQETPFRFLVKLAQWRSIGDGLVPESIWPGFDTKGRKMVAYRIRKQTGLVLSYNRKHNAYRLEVEPEDIILSRRVRKAYGLR